MLSSFHCYRHGRRSRGTGDKSPEFGVGDVNANSPPPDLVTQVQTGAFYGLQNTLKSVSGRVSAPNSVAGAHDAPQIPESAGKGSPLTYPTLLGTDPLSALAVRPPEFQPDLRLSIQVVS